MAITHPMTLDGSSSFQPGEDKPFTIGMRQPGRVIMKKQLDRDYTLTRLDFELKAGKFITDLIPAVIRIYQKDHETDAAYLILPSGVQRTYVSGADPDSVVHDDTLNQYSLTLSLEITSKEATREVIVDAFCPLT